MTYPSIQQYINAIENGRQQFCTLKKVSLVRDQCGEAVYCSSRSWALFAVRIDGSECSLRVFTSDKGQQYAKGTILENELYVARRNGGDYYDVSLEACMPSTAEVAKEQQTEHIASENRIAFCDNGKWGFRDNNGRTVVEPLYDSVQEFAEGRAVVEIGSMYGLIDKNGSRVLEMAYDELSYDGSHLCYVDMEGRSGVVDRMGRTIVPTEWDWVAEFSQGLLLVERDKLYGYVDTKGKVVIEPKYQNATSFDENRYATVRLGGHEFQIDTDGQRV